MEKWGRECKATMRKMSKMEKQKFMNPKYSTVCNELMAQLEGKPCNQPGSPEKELPTIQGNDYIVSVTKLMKKKYLV